jgi:hypothetical protein
MAQWAQPLVPISSLSSAAPHLFGDQLGRFEADLRELLRSVSPSGRFAERTREIDLALWSRPQHAGS